jgi:hypothetical protein
MAGDENQLNVAVGLKSISQNHRPDAPSVTLESPVPARRRAPRSRSVVDRAHCRSARSQRDKLPLRIAERLEAAQR